MCKKYEELFLSLFDNKEKIIEERNIETRLNFFEKYPYTYSRKIKKYFKS